jgi:uncharacterized membrane protein
VDETTEQNVIAVFENQDQAEQAAKDLMGWDKANDDIKLGAIGMVTRDEQGELQTRKLGARNTGKGAKVGLGLGALAAVLSGGLTLLPTAIGGAVAGGAVGALSRKGLGMSDDDLRVLWDELDGGRAALLVVCNANETEATMEYLVAAGGKPRSHQLSSPDLEEAVKAADSPSA